MKRTQIIGFPIVLIHFEPIAIGLSTKDTTAKLLSPKSPLFGGLTVIIYLLKSIHV